MATLLNVLGVGLEAVGVGLAALGTWQTWKDWGPEGEGITDPVVIPIRRAASAAQARLRAAIRRLLHRPATHVAITGSAFGVGAAMNARIRARKQFGVFHDDIDLRQAVKQLDDRTRELMDRVNDRRDELEDALEAVRNELKQAQAELAVALETVRQQTRRVATGGVRLGMLGLAIVAGGLLLQGAASLM
jgi:hypothetical protein